MFIALVSWIVIGALVGFIASKNVNLRGDDPKLGLASGVIGAVTAGVIYRIISGVDLGLSLRSVIFATVGAAVSVAAWHLMRRRAAHA